MKFIIGAIVIIFVLFFLMGLKSQKGKAKGIINGHLAEPGAAPNAVSSEADVQPEKQVAPLNGSLAAIKTAIIEARIVICPRPICRKYSNSLTMLKSVMTKTMSGISARPRVWAIQIGALIKNALKPSERFCPNNLIAIHVRRV